jgi:hypothetical protein
MAEVNRGGGSSSPNDPHLLLWLPPVIREASRARAARGERGEYAA